MQYAPYSYSKIVLFNKCPYAWKLKYIDQIEEEKHPALKLGSIVHEVIAEYLKQIRDRGEQSNHVILEQLIKQQPASVKEDLAPFIPAIRDIILPPGVKAGIELQLGVDQNFKPCEYSSESAFLRGKIDYTYRVEDTIVIIDWKTNQFPPPQEVIEDDWQTRFYALLTGCFAPAEVTKFVIELNYLRHRKIRKLEIGRDELNRIKEWIIKNVEAIENEKNFEPSPGDWCELCGYHRLCPVVKPVLQSATSELAIPEKIATKEQATKLAGMLKVLDQVRDRLQRLLKEWISEHGGINIKGEVLDFHQVETFKWETPEQKSNLAKKLLENGVNQEEIWDIFSVNKTSVCSFARKHGLKDKIEEILSTGQRHVYERFCFKKS